MSKTSVLSGFICIHKEFGSGYESLAIAQADNNVVEPLSRLLYHIRNKKVSIQYYISNAPILNEESALNIFHAQLNGIGDSDYYAVYSESTGYLYTIDDCIVGGHDLSSELRSYLGKFVYMKIEVH